MTDLFKRMNKFRNLMGSMLYKMPVDFRGCSIDDLKMETILCLNENSLKDPTDDQIRETILKCWSKIQLDHRRANPKIYKWLNENAKRWQKDNKTRFSKTQSKYFQSIKEKVTDSYCIRILRGKYDIDYIRMHPELIKETRERLITKRNKKAPKSIEANVFNQLVTEDQKFNYSLVGGEPQ